MWAGIWDGDESLSQAGVPGRKKLGVTRVSAAVHVGWAVRVSAVRGCARW